MISVMFLCGLMFVLKFLLIPKSRKTGKMWVMFQNTGLFGSCTNLVTSGSFTVVELFV